MIIYEPLWDTMKRKGFTTYTLRFKKGMSHATIQRLQRNQHVSTYTINKLCVILDCNVQDILSYFPDSEETAQS